MKRISSLALFLVLTLSLLAGCAAPAGEEKTELVVFAAASLQETLTTLGERYMAEHENVSIVFNFDSSGTLKTQIQEGAHCDLFLSAGQKQMNELDGQADGQANPEGLDLLLPGSRVDILENKVALVIPEGGSVASFEDLRRGLADGSLLLAMGNADVPVGQYTQRLLAWLGLDEEELAGAGCISYASNVKEVVAQVAEGAVDCGVVYQTDAHSAGLTVVDTATAEMCGQVVYPAAVLKLTQSPALALDFLAFLTGEAGDEVFSAVGFTPLG